MKRVVNLFTSKITYRLTALLFAIILFFYVGSERGNISGQNSNTQKNSGLISNKKSVIKMPLKVNIDNDKYYVTGYPKEVLVKVSGSTALVTALNNTKNFEVYADLNNLKPGEHKVKLKVNGLSNEIIAKIDPQSVTVKISHKKSKMMRVQARYDTNKIAKGYVASTPVLTKKEVVVTGAKQDVEKIARVVANINIPNQTKQTYSDYVFLQALDSDGRLLDVTINPASLEATLPIEIATETKKVPINLITSGEGITGKKYTLTSSTDSVILHGTRQALQALDSIDVPVSINGIDSDITKNVQMASSQSGVLSISPSQIEVKIAVESNKSEQSSVDTVEKSSSSAENYSSRKENGQSLDTSKENKKDSSSNE